jgi:hypothetical protein
VRIFQRLECACNSACNFELSQVPHSKPLKKREKKKAITIFLIARLDLMKLHDVGFLVKYS